MYNPLYNNISINYLLFNVSEDKFIPQGIIDHLVLYNPDNQKQEGYLASLHNNNFENNYNTIIADIKIKANQLHSRYMYSDIDNKRQDLILKLFFAINNKKSKTIVTSDITFSTLIYNSKNRLIFLND